MQEELEYLKTVRRKELAEEIKEARSHGDLSENSEYDEAKNTQGLVENRITELEQMVKNAVVIDESELSVENVSVGTHVTSRWRARTRPRSTTSWVVPSRPLNGKISDESPWATPAGEGCRRHRRSPAAHRPYRQLQGAGHHPTLQTEPSGRNMEEQKKNPAQACLRASRCRCAARSWQTCRLQAATPLP